MMKLRNTFSYLLVLVLVAGYFYYFELLKKRQDEQAERTAKKVFHVQVGQISAVEIEARGKAPLKLLKGSQWQITGPLECEVDGPALQGWLNTLGSLALERQVADHPQDVLTYGLGDPALRVRFQVGETWQELMLGDENPVRDGYYAKTADQPSIFLVSSGNYSILNKNLNELRRRQLFTFAPEDVLGLQVMWRDGSQFTITKEDGGDWKAKEQPEMVLKKSKVANAVTQIQWLRSRDFLTNDSTALAEHGLAPPRVSVKLRLRDNREPSLLLGQTETAKKLVTAVGSDLAGIVQLQDDIVQALPKDLHSLEDRSLVNFDTSQIKQVFWQLGETQGNLIQSEDNKWVLRDKAAQDQQVKEAWRVKALFWELGNGEYLENQDDTVGPPPTPARSYLEFWNGRHKLGSLVWGEPAESDAQAITLWRNSASGEGPSRPVLVKTEIVRKIEEKLNDIAKEK